jgi:hypothetical protein
MRLAVFRPMSGACCMPGCTEPPLPHGADTAPLCPDHWRQMQPDHKRSRLDRERRIRGLAYRWQVSEDATICALGFALAEALR